MKKLLALLALLGVGPAIAQQVQPPQTTAALVCAFNTSPPILTTGTFGYVQCDSSGRPIINPIFGTGTIGDGVVIGPTSSQIQDASNVSTVLFPGINSNKTIAYSGGVIGTLGAITPGAGYAQGTIIKALGAITAGSLYTSGTYSSVPLTGGSGSGATATISVDGTGVVVAASLGSGGTGYVIGDTLSVSNTSVGGTGSGFSIPVSTVQYINVALTGGAGTGATANITTSAGGAVTAVAIVNHGTNYAVNDSLSAASGNIGGGSGFSVLVAKIGGSVSPSTSIFDMLNTVSGTCVGTTQCAYNTFSISDTMDSTGSAQGALSWFFNYSYGGGSSAGNRGAVQINAVLNGGTATSFSNLGALGMLGASNQNVGGTSSVAKGAIFSANPYCRLTQGATWWNQCVGQENDLSLRAGASAFQIIGQQNVMDSLFTVKPSQGTYGYAVAGALVKTSLAGFDFFLSDGVAGNGFPGIATTGNYIICNPHLAGNNCGTIGNFADLYNYTNITNYILRGPQTGAGYGIDFLLPTFTSYALRSNNWSVDPSGFMQLGTGVFSSTASGPIIDAKGSLGTGTPTVAAGGSGYVVGDLLMDNNNGVYKVATVSSGAVATVTVVRQPFLNSTSTPANPVATTVLALNSNGGTLSGTFGSGATLNQTWNTTGTTLSLNPTGGSVLINGTVISTASPGAPYFSAHLSAGQSVTQATLTKIQFNTVDVNSGGYYDNVTNFRFTPLVAGKYWVHVQVTVAGSGTLSGAQAAEIQKNGTGLFHSQITPANTNSLSDGIDVTGIVSLNGTTDYLEGWAQSPSLVSPAIAGGVTGSGAVQSWFEAHYIGP